MNSKIKTYLISKGIDFSVPFLVDGNHLEKIDENLFIRIHVLKINLSNIHYLEKRMNCF